QLAGRIGWLCGWVAAAGLVAGCAGFVVWWLVLGCLRAASCPPTAGEGGCLLCWRPACWADWVMPMRLSCCWIGGRLRRVCDLGVDFRLSSRSKLPSHSG